MKRVLAIGAALLLTLLFLAPVAFAADPSTLASDRVLVAVNGDITVPDGEHAGTVVVVRGTATINGDVNTIVVVDGVATLTGATADSIFAVRSTVNLGPGTTVLGDVRTVDSPVNQSGDAQVVGKVADVGADLALLGGILVPGLFLLWLGFGVATIAAALTIAALAARQVRRRGNADQSGAGLDAACRAGRADPDADPRNPCDGDGGWVAARSRRAAGRLAVPGVCRLPCGGHLDRRLPAPPRRQSAAGRSAVSRSRDRRRRPGHPQYRADSVGHRRPVRVRRGDPALLADVPRPERRPRGRASADPRFPWAHSTVRSRSLRSGSRPSAAPERQRETEMRAQKVAIGAAVFAAGAALSATAVYAYAVGPWWRRWGVDPLDASAALPGDDLVADASVSDTRSLEIDAPPDAVWPWLVQMGFGRGGWYSYDAMDMRGRSSDAIDPDLQSLAVGDLIPTSPTTGFVVKGLDPHRSLVLYLDSEMVEQQAAAARSGDPVAEAPVTLKVTGGMMPSMPGFAASWSFVLTPLDGGARTHFVERIRARMGPVGPASKVAHVRLRVRRLCDDAQADARAQGAC